MGRARRSQREPQVMRHGIGSAEGNDSERRFLPRQTLEHIVNGAVASAGHDGIAAFANRHADLRCSTGSDARGSYLDFNAGRRQD